MYDKFFTGKRCFIYFCVSFFIYKYFFPKNYQKECIYQNYEYEDEWGQFVDIFY